MWINKVALISAALITVALAAPRTSGSRVASVKQFPYQVALITEFDWCGAVLISKDWILTSAQCLERAQTLTAILGAHDITSHEPAQVQVEISMNNVFLHEDWDRDTSLVNDIAALKLPESIQFTDYIQPVTLPRVSYDQPAFDGFDATTSGWSYEKSSELRYGSVDIVKQSDCSAYFQDGEVDASVICLNTADDTCFGDLGNPLVLKDSAKTLIGLASFGWSSGCVRGDRALFTSITSHVRWIYETTGVINNHF